MILRKLNGFKVSKGMNCGEMQLCWERQPRALLSYSFQASRSKVLVPHLSCPSFGFP
jgi:hypothetical protein